MDAALDAIKVAASEGGWTTALARRADMRAKLSALGATAFEWTLGEHGANGVLSMTGGTCAASHKPHEPGATQSFRVRGEDGSVNFKCGGGCGDVSHPGHWAAQIRFANEEFAKGFFQVGIFSDAFKRVVSTAFETVLNEQPLLFRRGALAASSNGSVDFAKAVLRAGNLLDDYRACVDFGWYAFDRIRNVWVNSGETPPNRLVVAMMEFSDIMGALARSAAEHDVFPAESVLEEPESPEKPPGPPRAKKARVATSEEEDDADDDGSMEDGDGHDYGAMDEAIDEDVEKEEKRRAAARLKLVRTIEKARCKREACTFTKNTCKTLRAYLCEASGKFSEQLDRNPALRAFSDGWLLDMDALRPGAPVASAIRRTTRADMLSVTLGAAWDDFDGALANELRDLLAGVLDVPHLDAAYPMTLSESWLQTLAAILHGDHARTGAMVFVYGYGPTGNSGKTSFGDLLISAFGGYAASVVTRIIAQNTDSDREPFLVAARKAVLLVCTESGDTKFEPERVNKLTGGGKMSVRTLYGMPILIDSRWALLAMSNAVLQWKTVNGGTMRRQRAFPWRKMAVPADKLNEDLPAPAPVDRRLRVVEQSGVQEAFASDPRFRTALIYCAVDAWRRGCISATGVISHVATHPLVKVESAEQQRSNPFDIWFDSVYELTDGPPAIVSKDAAYLEYIAAHAKEKTKMSKKEFSMTMAKISRTESDDDVHEGEAPKTRTMKEHRTARTRYWCIAPVGSRGGGGGGGGGGGFTAYSSGPAAALEALEQLGEEEPI